MKIPPPAEKPADSLPAPTKGGGRSVWVTVLAVASVCVIALLIALRLPPVQAARAAARQTVSKNHLRTISIALQNYHDTNWLTFPPAVVTDASGKPLYSGRVLLLRYLAYVESDQSHIDPQKTDAHKAYRAFDLTQAWDSPQNKPISQTAIRAFQDPYGSKSPPAQTDYLFVTGKGTMFEEGKAIESRDIRDGTSRTIAIVEVKNSGINWAEPRDLDLSQPMALPPGNHSGGNVIAMADGRVAFLPTDSTTPEEVRKLATRNGREP